MKKVVGSMLGKLVDAGKERLLESGPLADVIDGAKGQASAAMVAMVDQAMKGAGGSLGGLFGRK